VVGVQYGGLEGQGGTAYGKDADGEDALDDGHVGQQPFNFY